MRMTVFVVFEVVLVLHEFMLKLVLACMCLLTLVYA